MSLKDIVEDCLYKIIQTKLNNNDIYPGCSLLNCDNLNKETNTIIDSRLCFFCDVYKTHQALNKGD